MEQERFTLRCGELLVEVRPAYGGRITGFSRERSGAIQHFFRATPGEPGDVRTPFKTGCFPLVPFSNRIAHGRFTFRGRTIVLPSQPQASPHAIHGHGAVSSWTTTAVTADRIGIEYRHTPGSWPFDYLARQDIRLDPELGLVMRIEVTNLSDQPMPLGLGLHPFFDWEPGCRASFQASHHWLADADFLPHDRVPVPPALDFSNGHELGEEPRDHSFDQWDGHARILWPERKEALAIRADRILSHLILHRPSGLPYFCLEPVSHVTNAFNLADAGYGETGMRSLEPGEKLAASCHFTPETATNFDSREALR
jgi:aldose 1-epimerase